MSARDELQMTIFRSNRLNTQIDLQSDRRLEGSQLAWAGYAATAVSAAGYSKPHVLGYVVVARDGALVSDFENQAAAIKFAEESTQNCKDMGIDWDYRVATITEALS